MPRAVFKVFWDHLDEGKAVAAYVKNLAKDGAYYWVMALAYSTEDGYMSIRLKPGSKLFTTAKRIYKETLQFEKKKEKELGKRKGMYESEQYLLKLLKEEGYSSYDAFMWDALEEEMRNRERELKKQNYNIIDHFHGVPDHLKDLQSLLGKLFMRLESLSALQMIHSDYMLKLSRSILLLSLNAQVSSAKLDEKDKSITIVAENMGIESQKGEQKLLEIQEIVKEMNNLLRSLNFNIISAKLQVEMTSTFLDEISRGRVEDLDQLITGDEAVDILFDGFKPRLKSIKNNVRKLPNFIKDLRMQYEEIEKFLHVLRYIHTTGIIEASKMSEKASAFKTTFKELINEVDEAQERLDGMADEIYKNERNSAIFIKSQKELRRALQKIEA
jgi:aerotaxis receptor